ncbi:MAG TPA: lipase family protein [Nocardioides sp.]|nr:lipase family protein [Nocardioides sp.]
MRIARGAARSAALLLLTVVLHVPAPATSVPVAPAAAPAPPSADPFYTYDGSAPLASFAPGTVLKTRSATATLPVPASMTQLLYRTRDQLGRPTATVTSVLKPAVPIPGRVVAYQSFYDALTTRCAPSYTLNGGPTNSTWQAEQYFIQQLLLQQYTVVVSDFEGPKPAFATGPIYGYETLDGIRAAFNSAEAGLAPTSKVGMIGYSGGAIATEWAAELAPSYAPDVNERLVGAAIGGVFVHPLHNLHYVDGSQQWADVMPLAIIGIARAFEIDFTPYLSDFGKQQVELVKEDCIDEHPNPGLTFARLVKPQYARPESIPPLVETANKLIMGTGGRPTIPMLVRQGTGGTSEGTQPHPVYGAGDGVMLAGDVRSLARHYCGQGLPIDYAEADLGHTNMGVQFLFESIPWLQARFLGVLPATDTCAQIKPGNSLAPTRVAATPTCEGRPATIVGTAGRDRLLGTAGNDVIVGLGGGDTIRGRGGKDRICGRGGADRIRGGSGADRIRGGRGNDVIRGGPGKDRIRGGPGRDRITP